MRYIPSSRYTLDEIAEQCKNAIQQKDVKVQQWFAKWEKLSTQK